MGCRRKTVVAGRLRLWRNCLLCFVLSVATSAAQAVYTYDNGGRLTRVSYGAAGSVSYTYDAAGNLISRSVAAAGSSVITSVDTASGGSDIAQNTFIVITGVNLVPATTPAAGVNWSCAPSFASGQMPTQLDGVSVTVNGKPAYIYFFAVPLLPLMASSTSPIRPTMLSERSRPLDLAPRPPSSIPAAYSTAPLVTTIGTGPVVLSSGVRTLS